MWLQTAFLASALMMIDWERLGAQYVSLVMNTARPLAIGHRERSYEQSYCRWYSKSKIITPAFISSQTSSASKIGTPIFYNILIRGAGLCSKIS